MQVVRLVSPVLAFCLLMSPARAQWAEQFGYHCPGQWINGGQQCQCPDGSLAKAVGNGSSWETVCPTSQPQSACPYGTQECGSQCCNPGFMCSKYGCIQQGAHDCGSWACPAGTTCSRTQYSSCVKAGDTECSGGGSCGPGFQCSSSGRGCIPFGNTECGDHSCNPGSYCGSQHSCLAEGTNDCGNGKSCSGDTKCSRDSSHCLHKDAVDCGSHACNEGAKCGSGNKCLPKEYVDCGHGSSCPGGNVCRKTGGCATREQLAAEYAERKAEQERLAAEKKRIAQKGAAQRPTPSTIAVAPVAIQPSPQSTTATNPDIQRLLSDPKLAVAGTFGRTINGSIVDLRTGQVVATGGVTMASSTQAPSVGAPATPPQAAAMAIQPSPQSTTATNPDIQRLLSNPKLAVAGTFGRTINGSIVDLRTGQVVATGGVTMASSTQVTPITPPDGVSGSCGRRIANRCIDLWLRQIRI